MTSYQNCGTFASVVIVLIFVIKILGRFTRDRLMYNKRHVTPTLTSIPEKNENEEEAMGNKWVPKKKHEVLKAKYKCLKKLFQIYDASVIGILPEAYQCERVEEEVGQKRRKKRSHRTKTDACEGTSEISSGDVTAQSDSGKSSIANSVIRDIKLTQCSCTSTQIESVSNTKFKYAATQDSRENIASEKECEFTQTSEVHPLPYLVINEKRKLTRFQCFVQRIFGIRRDRTYKNYVLPNGHVYAASDNSINHNMLYERRRRRGLRFRRLRRSKKIQSECAFRDVKNPVILTYVQSVQRNCLMDTTPRQCPIVGCRMIFYGIINYNDHLNLCHFTGRKYICHYCHEGFENEYDKFVHENEHIGISKLNANIMSTPSSAKKVCDTQTDPAITKPEVPEEKLKKIVSFFDKISDADQILNEMKKVRYSDSNLPTNTAESKTEISDTTGHSSDSDKRTVSCVNLRRKGQMSSADSGVTSNQPFSSPVTCHFCGEHFNFRRQLSLHMDLEHQMHGKFSKFHSCAGIVNARQRTRTDMRSEDGQINVESVDRTASGLRRVNTSSTISHDTTDISRRKSEESLSCDPSTNIVYYTSMESVKKPSVVDHLVAKVRSGFSSYRWEPGTTIIRV